MTAGVGVNRRSLRLAAFVMLLCASAASQKPKGATKPADPFQELTTAFRTKLKVSLGENYEDHWNDLSGTFLNSTLKQAIENNFDRSQLSITWIANDQPLSDKSELIRTAEVKQLTQGDKWPCKDSCTDSCQLLFDTENTLRAKFSSQDLADMLFNRIVTSYSLTLKGLTLSVADSLKDATVRSNSVNFAQPIVVGGTPVSSVRPFFKGMCFPPTPTPVPKTAVAISNPQSEWSGTIGFAIGVSDVQPFLRLKDPNLHFSIEGTEFFKVSYSDANDKMLHCSLPFETGIVPTREASAERFLVLAEVFPESRSELGEVRFTPITSAHFKLGVIQRPQIFQVIAPRSPD